MNNLNLTKAELDKLVKSQDLELYSQEQFEGFISSNEEVLLKAEAGTLEDFEKSEYEGLTEEIRSFTPVTVYEKSSTSNRIEKSIMFIRPKQVEWDEDEIVKSEDGEEIVKARSGKYKDTALNRKLGRVGGDYGVKEATEKE